MTTPTEAPTAPAAQLPPGHRPPEHRIQRYCGNYDVNDNYVPGRTGCGQLDDHPRDVVGETDGTTSILHMDCHNCMSCVIHLDHSREANGGVAHKGLDLALHIQAHGDEIGERVQRATPYSHPALPGVTNVWEANQVQAQNAAREAAEATTPSAEG